MKQSFRICAFLCCLILLLIVFSFNSAKAETSGAEFCAAHGNLAENGKVFILPSSLQIIEEDAFEGTDAAVVIALDGVLEIRARAFSNMPQLRTVILPETVAVLGEELFRNDKNVTLYGSIGSEVEKYARSHQLPFGRLYAAAPGRETKLNMERQSNTIRFFFFIVAACLLLHRSSGRAAFDVNPLGRKTRIVLFHLDGHFP